MFQSMRVSVKEKKLMYKYTAINKQGKQITGVIPALSEAIANDELIAQGFEVVSIEVKPLWYAIDQLFPSLFAIKTADISNFSRQLATLVDAGIPLLPALETMKNQAGSRSFKKLLQSMITDLGTGMSFSQSLLKHPAVFNTIYCRTVAVAEKTGGLPTILRQMADYQEKQAETVKKVKKAIKYPATILVMSLITITVLMITALPSITNMFKTMNVVLPLPTRMLIALSEFMATHKLHILIVAIVVIGLFILLLKHPDGKRFSHRIILKIPSVGPALHSSEMARFCGTVQVLLNAGLSLQETMEITSQTVGNITIRESLKNVNNSLILGEGVAEPMRRDKMFPSLLVQMVAVGEESNNIEATLNVVAKFYENTADEKITAAVGKLQPALMAFGGLIVGWIAMSIMLPMYSLAGSMS
ncbi:MAG: type II secretion system F family protein [Chloroflexi bacterium]|nr:type II secretion system F family protein [Chloroflexota bacterium]